MDAILLLTRKIRIRYDFEPLSKYDVKTKANVNKGISYD